MTEKQSFEQNIRYAIWAAGLGAGLVLSIMAYAHATFTTKEIADERKEAHLKELSELKEEVRDLNSWLRENHKGNK